MNRLIYLFLFALIFWSCEDSVKFEEPQPTNKNDLKQIPKNLRGRYFSNSDTTYLTINERTIVERMDTEAVMLVDSLDIEIDSTKIVEGTSDSIQIIDGKYNLSLKFFSVDSVQIHYSYRDTLFEISDQHALREFRGHYFLNYKRNEKNWKVRRLTLDKNELSFSKVRFSEDIEKIKEITEVTEIRSDSGNVVGYKLHPTRKELKKLMKRSFSETKTYQKIN